ncbi:unnamed protein product, partial [Oppiella nova]
MCDKNSNVNYIVREMQLSDCREVHEILESVGFPTHKHQSEVIMNIDPNGQYVAQDIDTGKLLGYLCGVSVTEDLAYFGSYSVRPEYQGQGIGKALWAKTIEHLGDRNLGLLSHKQNTFEFYRDVRNFRYISDRRVIVMAGPLTPNPQLIDNIDGISLVTIDGHNVRDVIEYDKHVSGLDRSVLIESLYKIPENINLLAIDDHGHVVGYCFIHETNMRLYSVEPLEVQEIWKSVGFPTHKHLPEVVMNIDPNAQYVAQDMDTGKLLGYLCGVNVAEDLAYLGSYSVRPEYQGQGIGKALWAKTIEHLGDRNLGLVSSEQNTFEFYRDVRNFRYISDRSLIVMAGPLTPNPQLIDNIDGISLVTIDGHNVRDVIEYDKHVSGLDRSVLIEFFYKIPE